MKHTDCGDVKDIDVDFWAEGHHHDHQALVSGMCAIGGSSGGAVYKDHKAYGIVSAGGEGNDDNDDCTTTYQGIRRVEQQMNVTILKG